MDIYSATEEAYKRGVRLGYEVGKSEGAKHGRWTEAEDGDGAVCSVCGEDFCNVYLEVERFLYCPNCGAKMDLED